MRERVRARTTNAKESGSKSESESELLLCAPRTMRRCQLRMKRGQAMPSSLTAWEPVCENVHMYVCLCLCVCVGMFACVFA